MVMIPRGEASHPAVGLRNIPQRGGEKPSEKEKKSAKRRGT